MLTRVLALILNFLHSFAERSYSNCEILSRYFLLNRKTICLINRRPQNRNHADGAVSINNRAKPGVQRTTATLGPRAGDGNYVPPPCLRLYVGSAKKDVRVHLIVFMIFRTVYFDFDGNRKQ